MSVIGAIRKRISDRLAACQESARRVIAALDEAGIQAAPFGSTIRGDVHAHSDLDILIIGYHGMPRGQVLDIAEQASVVAVDVLFAEDVNPEALRLIMEQINNGHQIH